MKIWVDDFREAPDESWIVARKVESAIRAISQFDPTDEISLDHDIENRPSDETFKPVAFFIGEKYEGRAAFGQQVPKITIHSGNTVGAKEMVAILKDYGLEAERKPYEA